jgi:hypothetical protein
MVADGLDARNSSDGTAPALARLLRGTTVRPALVVAALDALAQAVEPDAAQGWGAPAVDTDSITATWLMPANAAVNFAAFQQERDRLQDMPGLQSRAACLGWSPGPRALKAAVAAMQRLLAVGDVKAPHINNFLWGLAKLQEQGAPVPATLPALLEAAAGWAGSRWGQRSALDIVDLCYNLAPAQRRLDLQRHSAVPGVHWR